jgi:serine phosphatase RsbU (regulator of sigma subunit)/integral membrane sensor domain MASE1/anti-sigma regulatory factor (Ser/Thr protein kinase)
LEPYPPTNANTSQPSTVSSDSTWLWPSRHGPIGYLSLFALVVVAYAVGSQLALLLLEMSGLQGVFFIPAGVTVALMIRLPRRLWWVILAGAGLAELTMDLTGGFSMGQSIGFTIANLAEPLVGASIVTTMCGPLDLARRKHVLWFTLGAVLAGPAVGAALGASTDSLIAGEDFVITFAQWWLGDALGVILIGGAILVWGSSPDRIPINSRWGAALVGASTLATVTILTLAGFHLIFLVLVVVVLAGALFGPRATAMTSLSVALTVAIVLAFDSMGVIVGVTPAAALVIIKLQIGTFALAGMAVAAEAHEREIAMERVAESRLEAEVLERERQREHDLAVQVQRGLLPDTHMDQPGFDITARHQTAEQLLEVGGDWYDVISLAAGRFGVVVGDIMGHGIRAMTSMGRLRTALSALAMHAPDPASLLNAVDQFVGGPDGTDYATVFYAIVDPEKESIQYASAGHPPALLLPHRGHAMWLSEGQSEPLSGDSAVARRSATTHFGRGSTLIMYTDGLIERRGESLSAGLSRLRGAASAVRSRSSREICDTLMRDLAPGAGAEDDVVVFVLRYDLNPAARFRHTYPAIPDELSQIRSAVRSWMAQRDIPEPAVNDMLIALGEAASNAVRHAFRENEAGTIRVSISLEDSVMEVEVSDDGQWSNPSEGDGDPGLGLPIISEVALRLQVEPTARGTIVTFAIPIETPL